MKFSRSLQRMRSTSKSTSPGPRRHPLTSSKHPCKNWKHTRHSESGILLGKSEPGLLSRRDRAKGGEATEAVLGQAEEVTGDTGSRRRKACGYNPESSLRSFSVITLDFIRRERAYVNPE